MKYRTLEQIEHEADVYPSSCMSRRERLERWADALERRPARRLATIQGTEFGTKREREAMRADLGELGLGENRELSRAVSGWLPPAIVVALLLAAWELAVRGFDVQDWLLPTPTAIVSELVASFPSLMRHAGTTSAEIAIGFALAVAGAAVLASGIAWSKLLERSIYPLVIASQTIPIIALAPLLLVWVGPEITSKVIVVVLISFFPIVVNLADGLRNTDAEMVNMMRTLGASRRQVFMKLQVPMSLPYFFSGLKVGAVGAVIGAVVGEWVGARGGLGWLMKVSSPQFLTERVFAAILVLSIIAVLLFAAIKGAERWALRNHAPRA